MESWGILYMYHSLVVGKIEEFIKQFKLNLSFVRFYSIKCLFSQLFEIHIYYSHECFQGK
jgi:hypothetical protein